MCMVLQSKFTAYTLKMGEKTKGEARTLWDKHEQGIRTVNVNDPVFISSGNEEERMMVLSQFAHSST